MKFLVLHGSNVNLLGRREPHIDGTTALPEINAELQATATGFGVELETFQSNREGALIDKLHENVDAVAGAMVTPAGLTQHGVPLHDALKAMPFPVLGIRMSNIAARETWRAHSIISRAVKAIVQGLGWRAYTAGFGALVAMAQEARTA